MFGPLTSYACVIKSCQWYRKQYEETENNKILNKMHVSQYKITINYLMKFMIQTITRSDYKFLEIQDRIQHAEDSSFLYTDVSSEYLIITSLWLIS